MRLTLAGHDLSVDFAADGHTALAQARVTRPDLVIADALRFRETVLGLYDRSRRSPSCGIRCGACGACGRGSTPMRSSPTDTSTRARCSVARRPYVTGGDLQLHHLTLRGVGGSDEEDNVIGTCGVCHLDSRHQQRMWAAPPADHVVWALGLDGGPVADGWCKVPVGQRRRRARRHPPLGRRRSGLRPRVSLEIWWGARATGATATPRGGGRAPLLRRPLRPPAG